MELRSDRLILEPVSDRHYADLRIVNGDPEVMRYLGGHAQTEAQTRAWIERAERGWAAHGYSWWLLRLAATGAAAGAGCIQHIEDDPAAPLEVGWRLSPAHWGHGYATEAARAMVAFAFGELGVEQVYANVDPRNDASIAVIRRLGMRPVGLRKYFGADYASFVLERPAA